MSHKDGPITTDLTAHTPWAKETLIQALTMLRL